MYKRQEEIAAEDLVAALELGVDEAYKACLLYTSRRQPLSVLEPALEEGFLFIAFMMLRQS